MVRFSVNILLFFVQRNFRARQHTDNKKPTKKYRRFFYLKQMCLIIQ